MAISSASAKDKKLEDAWVNYLTSQSVSRMMDSATETLTKSEEKATAAIKIYGKLKPEVSQKLDDMLSNDMKRWG
jgi:hypothetical protein